MSDLLMSKKILCYNVWLIDVIMFYINCDVIVIVFFIRNVYIILFGLERRFIENVWI